MICRIVNDKIIEYNSFFGTSWYFLLQIILDMQRSNFFNNIL